MGLPQTVKALHQGAAPLGIRVPRAANATDMDAIGVVNMFSIVGGPVLLTSFYGMVTVLSAGATQIRITYTGTNDAVERDLCVNTAINGDPVGTIYILTGNQAAGLTISTNADLSVPAFATNGFILNVGTIHFRVVAATNTGVIRWTLHYVPLEDNVYVSAV